MFVERATDILLYTPKEPHRSLGWALFWTRWATIAVLLGLVLAQPATGRFGMPLWALVSMFAANNLAIDLLGLRWSWPRSFARRALLDLPVAGLVYFLGAEHGGVSFALLFLAVVCAAASTEPRASLLYTAAAGAIVMVLHPTFAGWTPGEDGLRALGVDLVLIALAGAGTTILTRRLRLEQREARSMKDEAGRLVELDRLRTGFISTVSHELRTPLTASRAALGMLEASADGRLRREERQLLENARRNTELLGMLIDDLIALNQLESNTLHLERRLFDLRAAARSAASAMSPLFEKKGQTVELDLPVELPCEGDPRRMEQVIVNLLANVHRHTPTGTRAVITGRNVDGELSLSVSDDGPGIPPDELEAVFRRFYRLTPADGGSGLGLAIARSIVTLHGGWINAGSSAEGGVVFRLTLPVSKKEERPCR